MASLDKKIHNSPLTVRHALRAMERLVEAGLMSDSDSQGYDMLCWIGVADGAILPE